MQKNQTWLNPLVAALIFIGSIAGSESVYASFSNLSPSHPNYAAIMELQKRGVISGYPDGSFKPERTVNRAEALKMIILTAHSANMLYGSGAAIPEKIPSDLDKTAWYMPFVMEALSRTIKIVSGYPDGLFRPEKTVNLVESLKMALKAFEIDTGQIIIRENPYADTILGQWYTEYVEYARKNNLIDADSKNRIYPERSLNRGALAEILFRLIAAMGKTVPAGSLTQTAPAPATPTTSTSTTSTTTSTRQSSASTTTTPPTTSTSSTSSSPAAPSPPASLSTETSTTAIAPVSKIAKLLPKRLAIGLANIPEQLDWMKSSGVPWDYRYQYITGGVNTTGNWKTWNKPAGEFAARYMDESNKNGYIPVFSYYQIVPSKPHNVDGEPDINLNNADTMKAYFEDWKLLLQKAGQFGKTVIIQHEPDMWGYIQQQHGTNPADAPVAVASSGFAEAAGFANDAAGFARLLVKMKDTYAPNALLGWHVSHWASGNIFTDPVASATEISDFFNKLGSDFDLIFHDPSDRDAAFKELVRKDGGKGWWDEKKFVKYLTFLNEMTKKTGRKGIVWQVPIGNTLYRTVNNTSGHYQDNRPQYFLEPENRKNLVDYANAGIIAILFGGGEEGSFEGRTTTYYDRKKDGITNPPPINGNNLESKYTDDDGGYLRLGAGEYYRNGPVPWP